MIRVFKSGTTDFSNNGEAVLHPLLAIVRKEDNGEFYLELETTLSEAPFLTEGDLVVGDLPQGPQAFRIADLTKTKRRIKGTLRHVFYDGEGYLIKDSFVVDKNCNEALDHLNSATEPASPFTTVSDVSEVSSFRCVRKSLTEAIFEVLSRWGGHLTRDNFEIGIRETIGADNGIVIKYGKNLADISCVSDWSNVVTKLLPVGRDGITLPEEYLEADISYSVPYVKTVTFSQDINQNDYITEDGTVDAEAYTAALTADLRQQGEIYLNENKIPKVNYTLTADLEKVTDVGDTIEVIDERIGVNIMTNVIAFEYDLIRNKYTQTEFGNFRQKLSSLISTVNSNAEEIASEAAETTKAVLTAELAAATSQIWGVLGNSYVILEGDKILVVDSLPKETAVNVMAITSGGIGFSNTGISGTFNSAWTIDGTLNMQNINVINLVADLIKGGTLKLGTAENVAGVLELYDENNNLIGLMNKDGLKMYGLDGSYVLMNNDVGFAGFDRLGNKIYWVDADEFHMTKAVIRDEITLCEKMRFIPITLYAADGVTVTTDGIGLVSTLPGGSN